MDYIRWMKDVLKAILWVLMFPFVAPVVTVVALIEKKRVKREFKKKVGYRSL